MRPPKRQYILALICYLLIPAVVMAGGWLFRLIDPELARGHADYVRRYQLLTLARLALMGAAAGLAFLLWIACCYLVLKSRQRSFAWMSLAPAGPIGFAVIASLDDRSPAPSDPYQQFVRKLGTYWRVPFEIGMFVAIWIVAYQLVVLMRHLMIAVESLRTGVSAAAIIAEQNASSGMWAFGEGLEAAYLVMLMYLLRPIVFSLAGRPFASRSPRSLGSP
jgi:hypothetical protein